jgi:hypothetical protein
VTNVYTSPIVNCLLKLKRFIENCDTETGVKRSLLDPPKAPYHSLGIHRAVLSAGIPPLTVYPAIVINPPRESEVGGQVTTAITLWLLTNRISEDEALLGLLETSHVLRSELARHWKAIGGPVKMHAGSEITESDPRLLPGGQFEGQSIPPLQAVSLSIPIATLNSR